MATVPTDRRRGWRGRLLVARGTAVVLLFKCNDRLLDKAAPDLPAVWDAATLPWVATIEAGYPKIRAELEAYLAGVDELLDVARYSGLDPDSQAARDTVPLAAGRWRSIVLFFQGRWYRSLEDFPETAALIRAVPGVLNAGFSSIDPHTHIAQHRDPNKGALRYQLPVLVPGEAGDCRIRILQDEVVWREGQSVLFDLNVPHEVWNDSDGDRVLLMLEVPMPLPRPLALVNRFVQWSYRFFPSFSGMAERTEALYASITPR